MTNHMEQNQDPVALMRQAKGGDREAFGELYKMYFTPVYRFIYFKVGTKEVAEDITQTVFLRIYEARDRFEERTRSSLLAYFFAIARNAVIDHWRKKKDALLEETFLDPSLVKDNAASPLEETEQRLTAQRMQGVLCKLTSDQQEVIALKFMQEFSNQEIAVFLGKSKEAVRQLQCRALKALRTSLYEEIHEV